MYLAGLNKGPDSTGAPITATGGSTITVQAPETSSGGGRRRLRPSKGNRRDSGPRQ